MPINTIDPLGIEQALAPSSDPLGIEQGGKADPLGLDADRGQQLSNHIQTFNEATQRTQGLNDHLGIPHNQLSADLDAHELASVVAPVDPQWQDLANRFTSQNVKPSNEVITLPDAAEGSWADLQKQYDKEQVKLAQEGFGRVHEDGTITPGILPDQAEKLMREGKSSAVERDLAATVEGAVKSVTVAPVRTVEMLGRLESTLKEMTGLPMIYRLAMSKASPEVQQEVSSALGFTMGDAVEATKKFGDQLDQLTTAPIPQDQRGTMTKVLGSLGGLPALLLGGSFLGKYGTAAYLALQSGHSVSQTAEKMALQDGHSPEASRQIGNTLGSVTLPVSFVLNTFNPLSRITQPGAVGNNWATRMFLGGVGNYVVGKATQVANGETETILSDPLHRDQHKKQMYGYGLSVWDSTDTSNAVTGMFIGGITPPERINLEEGLKKIRIQPDVLNGLELQKLIQTRFLDSKSVVAPSNPPAPVEQGPSINGVTQRQSAVDTVGVYAKPSPAHDQAVTDLITSLKNGDTQGAKALIAKTPSLWEQSAQITAPRAAHISADPQGYGSMLESLLNQRDTWRAKQAARNLPQPVTVDNSAMIQGAKLLDAAIQQRVQDQGGTPEQHYAELLGGLKQQNVPEVKASLILTQQGARVINALRASNPTETFQGLATFFRDNFMDEGDRATVEKLFGVKAPDQKALENEQLRQEMLKIRDNASDATTRGLLNAVVGSLDAEQPQAKPGTRWTDKQNQQFGMAFEAYLNKGQAPTPELQRTFDQTSEMLRGVGTTASMLNVKMGEQLSGALDRMFIKDSDPVKAGRQKVGEAELGYQVARSNLGSLVDPIQTEPFAKITLPPLNPDVHSNLIQRAWDIVSPKFPDLAKAIKSIEPLDNLKNPFANASFNPATGQLRVSLDKPLLPSSLAHEFMHVEQHLRGEVKSRVDFASEEQFQQAMEAPAQARGEEFKQFDQPQTPPKSETRIQREADLVEARQYLQQQRDELVKAQQQNFSPRQMTRPEAAALQVKEMFEGLTGDADQRGLVNAVRGANGHLFAFLANRSDGLGQSPLADALREWGAQAGREASSLGSELKGARDAALNLMTKDGAENLAKADENGYSNLRKLIEPSSVYGGLQPSAQHEIAAVELAKQVWKWASKGIQENDFLRRMEGGNVVPTVENDKMLMPRLGTQLARDIADGRNAKALSGYFEMVRKANPGTEIEPSDLVKELQRRTNPATGLQGSLEGTRGSLNLPDAYFDSWGRQQNIFETNPAEFFNKWIGKSAGRLAFVRWMGQGMLPNLAENPESEGFYQRWQKLTDLFGATPKFNKPELENQLLNHGVSRADLINKTVEQLKEMTRNQGLLTRPNVDKLMDISRSLNANSLTPEQQVQLRSMADEAGGIQSREDPQLVLNELRHRMSTSAVDDLTTIWRNKWINEGGKAKDFDGFINSWHGVFGGDEFSLSSLKGKTLEVTSNAISGVLTTLAGLKHIVQPLRQAAVLGPELGIQSFVSNLVDAYGKGIFDKNNLSSEIAPYKLISDVGWNSRSKSQSMLVDMSRQFRQFMGNVSMAQPMRELNENVSIQMGRSLAEKWVTGQDFGKDSIGLARRLGLNDGEIQLLLNKGVKLGDQLVPLQPENWDNLYQKVVRNLTGYVMGGEWELPQNRSILESNPYLKRLAGFQTWASTSLRSLESVWTDFASSTNGVKVTDPAKFYGSGLRLLAMVGVGMGAGMLQHLMVNHVKAVPPEADKNWMDSAKGAIIESQLFGAPTNLLDSMRMTNSSAERFVLGWAPQVNALLTLTKAVLGKGRFGEGTPAERMGQAITSLTPALKAAQSHWEQETYPSVGDWASSRTLLRQWQSNQPGYKAPTFDDDPINMPYWRVFEEVRRNDQPNAILSLKEYMQGQLAKNPGESPVKLLNGLRTSLENRRPIPLSGEAWNKFIVTLPAAERQRVLATQNRYDALVNLLVPKTPREFQVR